MKRVIKQDRTLMRLINHRIGSGVKWDQKHFMNHLQMRKSIRISYELNGCFQAFQAFVSSSLFALTLLNFGVYGLQHTAFAHLQNIEQDILFCLHSQFPIPQGWSALHPHAIISVPPAVSLQLLLEVLEGITFDWLHPFPIQNVLGWEEEDQVDVQPKSTLQMSSHHIESERLRSWWQWIKFRSRRQFARRLFSPRNESFLTTWIAV